jgi:hypothetical protein
MLHMYIVLRVFPYVTVSYKAISVNFHIYICAPFSLLFHLIPC